MSLPRACAAVSCSLGFILGALSAGHGAEASTIYDLANDWSLVSNPNGPWSYNQGSTPLPFTQVNWGGITGETFWATTAAGVLPPAWTKAVTSLAGANDWRPGDVIGHSTDGTNVPPSGRGNVQWESPGDGTISLTGSAWDAEHFNDRNTNWSLSVAGDIVAARSTGVFGILRGDGAADFANNLLPSKSLNDLAVSTGDIVTFELAATSFFGHFVGVDLQIDFVPIPEPASLALLALAVGALSLTCRN